MKNIKFIPGENALILACAIAVLSFSIAWWQEMIYVLAFLIIAGLIFTARDYLKLRKHKGKLRITRQTPACCGRGMDLKIDLSIENSSSEKLALTLREALPQNARPNYVITMLEAIPDSTTPFSFNISIPERGDYAIGPSWVRVSSRFMLVSMQFEYSNIKQVRVYPESIAGAEEFISTLGASPSDKSRHAKQRGEGMEFDTLSPFQQGDDTRHIDWRASARHRGLLVRRHQIEQHREIIILLDCGRLMGSDTGRGTKLDRAIDSALNLSGIALARGDRCGFGVFDDRVLGYLPPQSGKMARHTILESIYNVKSEFRETNFSQMFSLLQSRQRKRALIVVISDIVDSDTSDRFRSALFSLAKRHVVIFAALRTPLLDRHIRKKISEYSDVTDKAVALRLEREREKSLHSLSRCGVNVIDVQPNELTVPLINTYIELRESNRL